MDSQKPLGVVVTLPPAVANITEDEERHGGEVKNAPIQCLCRTLAHLLRGFGTNGALGMHRYGCEGCYNKKHYQ